MKVNGRHKVFPVALPVAGSAILLILAALCASCGRGGENANERENIMTARSDTLSIVETKEGRLTGRFSTPLMEEYAFAPEPYREYPRGIDLVTFDSLGVQESSIRANYALYWIDLARWDLKGDVVGMNKDGDMVETQQLNWSEKTEKVWSNVQTRLTRGDDQQVGEGFEADQDFREWRFRKGEGVQNITVEPNRDTARVEVGADSMRMDGVAAVSTQADLPDNAN